jgi:DNA-binding NarL/FixJ family response regulator
MIERRDSSAAFRRRWLSATCTGPRNRHQHVRRTTFSQSAVRLAPSPPATTPLTAREREVAELIALGHTNRQIAERLVIAPRTADNHVQHIFDKLGLSSRAQVATWVAVRGLLVGERRAVPAL